MRIAIDATSAAVQHGGVGRYTRELIRALVVMAVEHRFILAAAATVDEADRLLNGFSPGAWREIRRLPASQRTMTALWQRLRIPLPVERWTGGHDVFHGPDFVLPPTGSATVVTVHDLSFLLHPEFAEPRLASYLTSALPRSIARADAVITVSASVAAEVAALFPMARGKLIAIPNGVRLPAQRPDRRPSNSPTALMVGTVQPRKNHRAALAAIKQVRARIPDAQLIIVGRPGWMADDAEREIRHAVNRGEVRWQTEADDTVLELAYAEASVVVSPSHYEGFGLPVIEAMARGVPVVASDIRAHREVAGDAALYAEPTDADALAARMLAVLEDVSLSERLSDCGIVRASAFSWSETARRTLRVYQAVSGRERP